MPERTLISRGFVLSQDPLVGDLPGADVLIEDGVIVAIGRDLPSVDAECIDGAGTIVIPGFVDTHRHTWESTMRGLLPDCTLGGYLAEAVGLLGPLYSPEDIYTSTRLGALEAINAGITTLVDWAHCNNTPEHADAGVSALQTTGIRAMYAYGPPSGFEWWGQSELIHPDDARRVREQYFASDDDLLTFALALRGPAHTSIEVARADWALARSLEARITVHVGMRIPGLRMRAVHELAEAGLLGNDTTYVHANGQSDQELRQIADSGGTLSIAPYVEMLMGHGHPPTLRALAAGLTPALSVDVATSVPGDMFTQMRTALAQGRMAEFSEDEDVEFAPTLTHTDVLRFATSAGAAACGLGERVGSITVGKAADLVLIRADSINTMPIIDPVATVVTSADTSNVDTVLVGGRVRKRGGQLVDVDTAALRTEAETSRDRLLEQGGLLPEWLAATQ